VVLEQLYPFPHDQFKIEIDRYKDAKEIVWCQEEPGNQGAWHRIQHYLQRQMLPNQKLSYALRPSSSTPAGGYLALHNQRQKAVVDAALAHGV
jgi:2-oxoglutarate dehydrogenase E1 component